MPIDLRGLSARQLGVLIAKAKEQQTRLAKRTPIATIRSKITRFAKAEGYTIEELFGIPDKVRPRRRPAKSVSRTGRKIAPKYRNPANPKETWTGRGRQPRWLAALVAKGKKPENFLIGKK